MKLIKQSIKKLMVSTLMVGVLIGGVIGNEVDIVNAQGSGGSGGGGSGAGQVQQPAASDTLKDSPIIKNLTEVINVVMVFLAKFLWPVIIMIGALMGNDLLFGGPMEQTLLTVWLGVRDVVHVLFVIALLFIAIINILGVTQRSTMQEYEIKKILPRLIVSLIAINFSFLICKVSLDAVQVIATGIMGLGPVQSQYKNTSGNPDKVSKIAKNYCDVIKENLSFANAGDNAKIKNNLQTFCQSFDAQKAQIENYFKQYNASNAALIMAIDLQSIVDIQKVSQGVKNLKDLTINALFAVAFFIMYAVAYIALFVALMYRVVVLWIVIALSPLIALGYAVPAVKTRVLEGENDLQKNFLEHAIIPIPVAVVMSLGMVMSTALKSAGPVNANLDINATGAGVLLNGMSNFQDIIVAAATVGFLWMAVFTVTAKGKAEKAVGRIKEFVTGIGGYAVQAPLYLPILPTKSGNVSIGGLSQLADKPREVINEQMRRDRIALGIEGAGANETLQKLKSARSSQALREALSKMSYDDYQAMNAQQKKELAEEIKKRKSELQKAGVRPPSGYADFDKFAEALESGQVDRSKMNEFLQNFKRERNADIDRKIREVDGLIGEAKGRKLGDDNNSLVKQLEEAKAALVAAKNDQQKFIDAEAKYSEAKVKVEEAKKKEEEAKKKGAANNNNGGGGK